MMRRVFVQLLLLCTLIAARGACAAGMDSLDTFLRTVGSARAEFSQVVTAPARDGQAAKTKTSSGSFEFSRPGKFRFVYRKPFDQTIVADGQTLWLFDAELNQVTARKQAQALGSTPAALIASARASRRWPDCHPPRVRRLRVCMVARALAGSSSGRRVSRKLRTRPGQAAPAARPWGGRRATQLFPISEISRLPSARGQSRMCGASGLTVRKLIRPDLLSAFIVATKRRSPMR